MFTSRRSSTVMLSAAGLALAFVASACGSSSSGGSPPATTSSLPAASSPSVATSASTASLPSICGGTAGSGKVLVASQAFGESETLAAIYAAALKECGYNASTKSFASREVYYPQVVKGKIQVVPEYAATLTDFINDAANGATAPSKASGNISVTMKHLRAELPSNLTALNPATSTDKNSFAVTKAFANANHITTMSQLATYSKSHPLELAGPPECPTRPFCEPGLKSVYGMKFKGFKQTDEGGSLTVKAIKSGAANVGLVFTSDPTIAANGLVVLTDDKQLQASDNIVPLVAKSLASGAAASALNAVDAKLDQTTLVDLNKAVEIDHGTSAQVATQFLKQEGLD
ncbi:MAG TPA: ABC transporter substrate-binding protein [Mycobacteriales bacterium]|jgi:osmoprotectant transport system substrate-binding protein|nr:ABC transporter substrate-binding protein [Mycobacteriales bacterium]